LLRAAVAEDAKDIAARVRLAEAYRLSAQPDSALRLLEPVAATEPSALLYLGLVYEDLERFADARRVYQEFLERGRNAEVRERVRDRLALLERLELQQAIRVALAREQQLAGSTPAARTVGVFPFVAIASDPDLQALGVALAELLTTDLAQTDRLTVLERTQVQRLLDEIQLGASGRVDASTAARSGRILGAGSIVQGRVEAAGEGLSLQAAVLRVPTDTIGRNPLRERDALSRIFELEKRLALSIFEQLGVQLTDAERQRVTRVPTSNVQALIAFGYGLAAQDAGRHSEAVSHFVRALDADPSFDAARAEYDASSALLRAETVTATALGRMGALETGATAEMRRWQRQFLPVELLVPNPSVRDPAAEAMGIEGASRQGAAELVIRRPGGTP
jgi:tetratricopeptide (TPR) repeat protein